ncbi:MAG TPA: Fic family protein [archaeon]|jgi:Fic family protein|nr:Fic family protein [archaeon]
MAIIKRIIGNKEYYYLEEQFRIIDKLRKFRKYLGSKKPSKQEQIDIENQFLDTIIARLTSSSNIQVKYISKKQLIQILLFNQKYFNKYNKLTPTIKNKLNIDNIVLFTLTTLTTEDIDVSLEDVINAQKKDKNLNQRELICKNMLKGIDLIKKGKTKIDINFIKNLHKTIMADFETKTPGLFRTREVHIYKKHTKDILSAEIKFQPPAYGLVVDKLNKLIEWYNSSDLNNFEKAILLHFEIYKIHPFLDGNKRVCRLLFNKVLLDNNFPLVNISDNRTKYFDSLLSSVEENNPAHMADFMVNAYLKQVKTFIGKDES